MSLNNVRFVKVRLGSVSLILTPRLDIISSFILLFAISYFEINYIKSY